jgi:hypothetical protein
MARTSGLKTRCTGVALSRLKQEKPADMGMSATIGNQWAKWTLGNSVQNESAESSALISKRKSKWNQYAREGKFGRRDISE